jgi:hypothetical protein
VRDGLNHPRPIVNHDFREPFQADLGCPALGSKIFLFTKIRNCDFLVASCTHKRGASRSSRTLDVGCDGRGGARKTNARPLRTAKPCGPGPPMLGSSCAKHVFRPTTGAKKPAPRGERGVSRKPLRREGRCFGVPVMILCAFFFLPLHTRLRVRADAPGLPCALCLRAMAESKPRADHVAGMRTRASWSSFRDIAQRWARNP